MGKVTKMFLGIMNGEVRLTNVRKYTIIVKSVCIVHFLLLVYFTYLNIVPLMIFNLCSVILYFSANLLVRKQCWLACFLITYCEICFHTVAAIYLLGSETSFLYYSFALIPVSYYVSYTTSTFKRKMLYPLLLMFVNFALAISCNVYLYRQEPPKVLTSSQGLLISCFNIVVAVSFLTAFSVFFVIEIRDNQHEMNKQNMKLNYYAQYDPLTALLNRRSMKEKMTELQKKGEDNICVVISDIDDFKRINDTFGHECGDKALVHISAILKELLPNCNLCRWGGEEFLFIWKGTEEECRKQTEKVRKAIEQIEFRYKGEDIHFTMTFGLQKHSLKGNLEKTISLADEKLYRGKQSGKNCVV